MQISSKKKKKAADGFLVRWLRDMRLFPFLPHPKQVRIHESTVACDWAGAVMPENHEKNKIFDIFDIFENLTFLKILDIFEKF